MEGGEGMEGGEDEESGEGREEWEERKVRQRMAQRGEDVTLQGNRRFKVNIFILKPEYL